MLLTVLFVAGWCVIAYVYLVYPLVATILSRPERALLTRSEYPRMTLVFCAHNEEAVLPEKIQNCITLDYPADRLEFCVGSDGATDSTNVLLTAWAQGHPVQLLLSADRVGKTELLNRMVPNANGEIVLFSDASTLFAPDALRRHAEHYSDPSVGCVGGDLEFVNTARSSVSAGHGLYWRYERHLRQCESALGTLAYVAGANYSMRRHLWKRVAPHFADDCNSPLNVIEQGYRVVHDPRAVACEVAAESSQGLLKRRVRMVTRDMEATLSRSVLLNPIRFPGVAWSLWSHKLLRWLGAPVLVLLAITNLWLLDRPFYQWLLVMQLGFYSLAVLGHLLRGRVRSRWLSLPLYFSLSNLAALLGVANVLGRRRAATWQPGGAR